MKRFKLALVLAGSVLAMSSAARAQNVDVFTDAGSVTHIGDQSNQFQDAGDGNLALLQGGANVGALHYSSNVNVGSQISFESGTVAVGKEVFRSQSVTSVDLQAYYDGTVNGGKLVSQITAAGMGFYVSSGNCMTAPMTCSQSRVAGDNFSAFAVGSGPEVQTLASVSFNFQVSQTVGESTSVLKDFNGTLNLNVQNGAYSIDLSGAPTGLTGLQTLQYGLPDSDFGYTWGATDLPVDLNSWSGYSTISYQVSVMSTSNVPCLADGACIVAYSGFGDPIGGGGEIGSNAASFGAGGRLGGFSAGSEGGLDSTCNPTTSPGPSGKTYINCVTFSPTTFALPTFENGVLTFAPGGAVPEPASWALMIAGFGAMGATLRRRRSAVAAA